MLLLKTLLTGSIALTLAGAAHAEPAENKTDEQPAAAEDPYGTREGGSLFVVQNKLNKPAHEFHLAGGYLPQHPYWRGVTGEVAYRFHLNDWLAIEPIRFAWARTWDTPLKEELLNEFPEALEPDPFHEIRYMATGHAVFTPFYGKSVLMNRRVFRQEVYFLAGGGGVAWELNGENASMRPTGDFGAGLRYWIGNRVSVRVEVLENLYQKVTGEWDDMFYVTAGVTVATLRK